MALRGSKIVRLAGLMAVLALTACSAVDETSPVEALEITYREIAQGEIVGTMSAQGAHVWRAIPFAAAPVGDLRWRAPRPPLAFDGRFEALDFGPRCPQVTNALDEGEGLEAGLLIGAEDCLTLDVYAPPGAQDLPVMVWIHGGANVWGRSSAYNGSQLALDQDVIVIALQYRLGPLGWLSHPNLRASAETEADEAASFALLDMIAALEWVQTNVAAFGGDADRVTVFGESAGGHNVAALLAAPRARGLFHGAIIQSGLTWSVTREQAEQGSLLFPNPSQETAQRMTPGEVSAETLRSVSLADLFGAYDIGDSLEMPLMIEDDVVLPRGGIRQAAATPDGFADVPIITGTNRDEMRLYTALNPDLVRRIGLMIWPRNADAYEAIADYPSRLWRVLAVDDLANRLNAAGHQDVWAYRFDWDEGGSLLLTDSGQLFGAAHGMEIPFVFNHFELYGALDQLLFTDRNASGREAVAAAMGAHWGALAHTGAPGEAWSRWQSGGALLRFDSPEAGGMEMITGEVSLDMILTALMADDRLDDGQRCFVARELMAWSPQEIGRIATVTGCLAAE